MNTTTTQTQVNDYTEGRDAFWWNKKRSILTSDEQRRGYDAAQSEYQSQLRIVAVGRIREGRVELHTDTFFAPSLTPVDNDPALATPFQVGVWDADEKMPFAPETYYVKAQHKLEYSYGFAAIRPDCEPALDMIAKLEAAYMAQLADERDESYDTVYVW